MQKDQTSFVVLCWFLVPISELTRAKFDRITDWINQMRPPTTADVGRVSFRAVDVPVEIYSSQEKWTLILSHQDTWLPTVISAEKNNLYLFRFLFLSSYFIYCSCEHTCAGTPLLLKSPRNTDAKSTRGSRKALIKGTVLWNIFCSLYHLLIEPKRGDADVVPQARVESVTSLWFLKLIVFLNNCTMKSSEVDCLLDICYTWFFRSSLSYDICIIDPCCWLMIVFLNYFLR